ncbi:PP2C family serine/threonine-protein phosphatase, partial [Sphingomonas sp. LaA6.9]|uniref:PP2C family protein-serine/threonine phosphatase n=1 Tax=Sphingomonas sp. LaA6.9 TaxID=2919914 RepID=UPI001F4F504B
ADGMGGHAMGDEAATTVIRALASLTQARHPIDRHNIADALSEANATIIGLAQKLGKTCGSTVAGIYLNQCQALVFWAGDSRVYRFREKQIKRLTRDHSLVQELADAGVLNNEQARTHHQAHVITRAIGVADCPQVEFAELPIEAGDVYLVCSDGLSSMIDDGMLASILGSSLVRAADELVRAALGAGGMDNISLVLIAVDCAPGALSNGGSWN